MGPQYNKTGSHTPQIYFWLFPENICNQQDMLHIFIYTEGAQFPPTTIICSKKKYYRQSKKLWLLGFVSCGPGRFGILSSLSVVFVSLPLRKSCGFGVFLTGPVFFFFLVFSPAPVLHYLNGLCFYSSSGHCCHYGWNWVYVSYVFSCFSSCNLDFLFSSCMCVLIFLLP